MIANYGQAARELVLVSSQITLFTHPAYQRGRLPRLFRGILLPGIPYLEASFTLRCLQRLSLPNTTTEQCHWRDNSYIGGSSIPVLSY